MEEFNGMSRNTIRGKTPIGMWQNAKNILINKKRGSITQEEGFDFVFNIPGKVVGKIETNEHIVFFSIDNGKSRIGYKDRNETYIPILNTQYLNFNIKHPIEGIYYYNYKGELIILFCDGVLDDSNPIRLINLNNLGIELDSNLELINPADIVGLFLFPPITEGNIEISYSNNSTLPIDIAYVTFSYILDDGISSSPFYVVQHIAYPTYGFDEEKRRAIILSLTDLDIRYNKLRIGILVNTDNGLEGYQSNIISYTGSTLEITINSLSNYTSIAIDNLVVPSIIYTRAETITKQYNKIAIGKTAINDTIDFQKYANMLELESLFIDDTNLLIEYEDQYFTHPTLCFDEVYSISIQPQLLDGTYLDSFHIPGRAATGDETSTLTISDLTNMGLADIAGLDTYKKFRIINTGGFVNPPPYNDSTLNSRRLRFGYWENQETYPIDDNYNSTVDYNGNPLGGIDLRGTPIKYHRIAGLDNITAKVPSFLGYTEKDKKSLSYNENGFVGKLPRVGLRLLNFDTVVPLEVRNQLQGFRINIAKRKDGERLVEDINFIKQTTLITNNVDGEQRQLLSPIFNRPSTSSTEGGAVIAEQFGTSTIYSSTLEIYKPAISPTIIKANYAVKLSIGATAPLAIIFNPNLGFYKINETQKYAVVKNIKYLPGNNIPANTLFLEDKIILEAKNNLQSDGGLSPVSDNRWNPLLIPVTGNTNIDKFDRNTRVYLANSITDSDLPYTLIICSTLLNLPKNVYSGFNTNDFITLGRTTLNKSTVEFKRNGDVFLNNKIDYPIGRSFGTTINGAIRYYDFDLLGILGIPNNSRIYIEDNRELKEYNLNGSGSESTLINTFTFTPTIYNREVYRSLNDKITALSFDINTPYINYFPFRVALSLSIANENLQTNNVRTFLANNYYEMPNDKGDIVALRGTNKNLYIQQRYTLHIASIKDKLTTQEGTTYLGESTLFDRIPNEIFDEQGGYIGSTSKFSCIVIKEGYVVVDQVKGNIFIIGQGIKEISKAFMDIWFEENWNIEGFTYLDRNNIEQKVDNPYNSVGHLVGKDNKYNRLLFTKKLFSVIGNYTFDGEFYYQNGNRIDYIPNANIKELSVTFSYLLDEDRWVCEHDFFPNIYTTQNKNLYSIRNNAQSKLYRHNSLLVNPGTYYDNITFPSFVDLVFNGRNDLVKLYQAVLWNTTAINNINSNLYRRTIDAIMLYTENQCTGEIELTNNEFNIHRNNEGIWNFNEFRDIVINNDLPIVNENGTINISNLNINRSWFDKSNFISTFIIIRMIMKNLNKDNIYINNVNVKSRTSQR